jgi:signal transduction histidine kinase
MRLTLGFAGGMVVVLAALAFFVDWRVEHDLTAGIDMDLRSRGQVVVSAVRANASDLVGAEGRLIDPDEAFAQVLVPPDRIVDSSSAVSEAPMLSPAELRSPTGPAFSTTVVRGIDDPARLLAIPVRLGSTRAVVVIGATLGDRNEALDRLRLALVIGGSVALVLVSLAGWLLAGAALRPVEAMRREAAAISASEPARRLPVREGSSDELARLATTLNEMLDRLQASMETERRFLDQASHELRTPLTVLRMELDLALARARSPEELRTALENASVETDRLVRLSEDLLVLGRAQDGRLPLDRRETDVAELLRRAAGAHAARAEAEGVTLRVEPADGLSARVDPDRVRQAVDDLLDNAFRHGGRAVVLAAAANGEGLLVSVEDDGPGFPAQVLSGNGARSSNGLGLTVVRAIAAGHGGTLALENSGRGARAVLSLPN